MTFDSSLQYNYYFVTLFRLYLLLYHRCRKKQKKGKMCNPFTLETRGVALTY